MAAAGPSPSRWPLLLALQMLPATMLTPAVRPLFAAHHGGRESAMHAFFSLAMAGAILATPLVVWKRPPIRSLLLLDLVLLLLVAAPLPLPLVLTLRAFEGGAHVGTTTLLMAGAAEHARRQGCRRTVPAAAAAVSLAVAFGSAFGGAVVHLGGPLATFGVAAALLGIVFLSAPSGAAPGSRAAPSPAAPAPVDRSLFATAFLGRFLVGCLVVTFALFAHRVHHVSDGTVGALFAAVTIPFALATYPLGRLAATEGAADRLAAGGAVGSGAALLGLGFVPTALLPLPLVAFGLGGAALFASAVERSARGQGDRGRAMGALQAAGCAGMLVGPIVAGVVSALTRSATDPARAPRAVFLLGATFAVGFAAHGWLRSARSGTALAVSPEKWRSSPRIGSR